MLELKNIRFDVQEGHQEIGIIRDVSFTIPDNKFVVVTGPNGGGKSTLARLIAGIEKPTAGTILLDGEDITQKSITERARMGISYAMQQPARECPSRRRANISPRSASAPRTISSVR